MEESTRSHTDSEKSTPSQSFRITVAGIKKKFPRVKNVSTSTLATWMNGDRGSKDDKITHAAAPGDDDDGERMAGKLVIFDVRPTEEYDVSHIPSAIRLDPGTQDMGHVKDLIQQQIHSQSASGEPDGKNVEPVRAVMYCSLGYRSSAMADRVQKALSDPQDKNPDKTFQDLKVYNLEGSIFKWANENRTIVDVQGEPTQFIHPYSRLWGLLVDKNRWKWSVSNQNT